MVKVTYPGVFVEELPSGVHTVTGAPTSVTAFVGRTPRGPVNEPVRVSGFGDYERRFGGLDRDSTVSYTVRGFFDNGGAEALILRLYEPQGGASAKPGSLAAPVIPAGCAKLSLPLAAAQQESLVLVAADPGSWGNGLTVAVDTDGITEAVAQALPGGLTAADLFNLTVTCRTPDSRVQAERYLHLTVHPDGGTMRIDRVLAEQSTILRVPDGADGAPALPPGPPAPTSRADGRGGEDSAPLTVKTYLGDEAGQTGLFAMEKALDFNILTIPPDLRLPGGKGFGDTPNLVYQTAASYCVRRRAMLIVDAPGKWRTDAEAGNLAAIGLDDLGSYGVEEAENSAAYFPRIVAQDPLRNGEAAAFPASGAIAGIWAATDMQSGVWKAPAGLNAPLNGISRPEVRLNDAQNGVLNPLGINCLREFAQVGTVVWGARTMRGADLFGSDYKYVAVRRLALYVEKSLVTGTEWAVFEPNDESLWAQLRQSVRTFLADLYRQGAFFGDKPDSAYFVRCDATTTTPADQSAGVVNIEIGFAPVRPAEFVILTIRQKTLES